MRISKLIHAPLNYVLAPALLITSATSYANNANHPDAFQFDLITEILTAGELDVDEDALIGGELKYFFNQNQTFKHFIAGGYKTDMENAGSSVDIFNLDIGSQYALASIWGNRTFVEYSIGAIYQQTDYSIALIDRETSHWFDEFNYKASVAVGFDFQDDFSSKLFINRLGDSTTIGLGLSYRF